MSSYKIPEINTENMSIAHAHLLLSKYCPEITIFRPNKFGCKIIAETFKLDNLETFRANFKSSVDGFMSGEPKSEFNTKLYCSYSSPISQEENLYSLLLITNNVNIKSPKNTSPEFMARGSFEAAKKTTAEQLGSSIKDLTKRLNELKEREELLKSQTEPCLDHELSPMEIKTEQAILSRKDSGW